MVDNASLLRALARSADVVPVPSPPAAIDGRPKGYSDRLFLKAAVIMIVHYLATAGTGLRVSLLAVLERPMSEMKRLRALLAEAGRYPCPRTWERRRHAIPDTLPAPIACLGHHLVERIQPVAEHARATALDRDHASAFTTPRFGRCEATHRKTRGSPNLLLFAC